MGREADIDLWARRRRLPGRSASSLAALPRDDFEPQSGHDGIVLHAHAALSPVDALNAHVAAPSKEQPFAALALAPTRRGASIE